MKKIPFNEKYEYIDKTGEVIKNNEDIDKAIINKGGFGDVYRIRDRNVKTEFILKKTKNNSKIPYLPGETKMLKDSFVNEKNFLIAVKGTNILNIIDYYFDDEKNYSLILEKMDGNLDDMLENYKNGMSSKLIRKIFSQINSGLKIMIKKKQAHRDLKPENILFSYTNDEKTDFIIKIGDFGFAKNLKSTKEGTNLGTYFYKAPEIRGEEPKYSNKCDLYSIGIILYVLKTGDKYCKNIIDFFANLKKKTIKNETDDEKLNSLINQLVVSDPHKRMEWKDYFIDPFFKENDEVSKDNEECKKILIKLR
jgi:serine/threonine kinase 33